MHQWRHSLAFPGSWRTSDLCPVQHAPGLVSVLPSQSPQCIPTLHILHQQQLKYSTVSGGGYWATCYGTATRWYLVTVACVGCSQAEVGWLHIFVDDAMLVDMLQCCQHASGVLHKAVVANDTPISSQPSQVWTCDST